MAILWTFSRQEKGGGGRTTNAVSMLAHRLRRWPNIKTALGESLVFAGVMIVGATLLLSIWQQPCEEHI